MLNTASSYRNIESKMYSFNIMSEVTEMSNELVNDVVGEEFYAVLERIKSDDEDTKIADQNSETRNDKVHRSVQTFESADNDPLSSLCRLCATRAKDMVHMFGPNEMNKNLIEKIERCLPIVVKKTDTLPKHACQMCLAKLELCFQFHKAVQEAEKQLLMFDHKPQSVIDEVREPYQSSLNCNGHLGGIKLCDSLKEELETSSYGNADNDINSGAIHEEVEIIYESVENNVNSSHLKSQLKTCGTDNLDEDNKRRKSLGTRDKNADSYPIDAADLIPHLEKESVSNGELSDSRLPRIMRSRKACDKETLGIKDTVENILSEKFEGKAATHRCDECGKKFATGTKLRCHKLHHEYIAELRRCKKFDAEDRESSSHGNTKLDKKKKFRTQEELKAYQKVNEKTYKCVSCNRRFHTEDNLEMHKNTRCKPLPISKEQLSCSHCGKAFSRRRNLVLHIRRQHSENRPYDCDLCGRNFWEKQLRDSHRGTHTGERCLKCSICEKTFAWPDSLHRHTLRHSGLRPYKCSLCSKSFYRLDAKNRHMVAVHTVEKPYQCDVCKAKFKEGSLLRRHKKIQHGPIVDNKCVKTVEINQ